MAENIAERPRRDSVHSVVATEAKPPSGLSKGARGIWQQITTEWVLDASALLLLRAALEQLDVYDMALKQVKKEDLTVQSENGMLRAHPAAKVGHDALGSCRQLFRQTGLEPPEA